VVSLYCSGLKPKEIAKKVGLHYGTVRKWLTFAHIKEQIAQKVSELEAKNDQDFLKKRELLEIAKNILCFDPRKMFDEYGNLLEVKDMRPEEAMHLSGIDVNETIYETQDGIATKVSRTKKLKWYSKMDAMKEANKMLGYLSPQKVEGGEKPIRVEMQSDEREAYQAGARAVAEALKNGTIDKRDHPGLRNTKGHIGFLGHGSVVKFRNIRIKDLLLKP